MKIHPLFLTLATAAGLHAQDAPSPDPYIKNPPTDNIGSRPMTGPRNISICHETFSVPLALAAKLRRERKPDAELYARLAAAGGKEGIRQETFDVLRCKSGHKALAEAITEEIYPTEFLVPKIPSTVGGSVPGNAAAPATNLSKSPSSTDGPEGLAAPATPAAFDTRNVGRILEFEPVLVGGPAGPFVDLRLSPEIITYAGRDPWGQGVSQTDMPVFESQRLNTAITVRLNQPSLIGTLNRPPGSQVDPDSAKRIWFAFVTVKAPKP